MTHYSRISKVVIDVDPADHDATLAFWSGAVGGAWGHFTKYPEYHGAGVPGCGDLSVLVQHLGAGPSRVHLDIHTDDRAAETDRLMALGARVEFVGEHWTVLRDPAGLPFCIIPDAPGSLNDANAQRWD